MKGSKQASKQQRDETRRGLAAGDEGYKKKERKKISKSERELRHKSLEILILLDGSSQHMDHKAQTCKVRDRQDQTRSDASWWGSESEAQRRPQWVNHWVNLDSALVDTLPGVGGRPGSGSGSGSATEASRWMMDGGV